MTDTPFCENYEDEDMEKTKTSDYFEVDIVWGFFFKKGIKRERCNEKLEKTHD